jgi:hypothetical protein
MATPLHRPPMTREEFVALPEDDTARYELQEGALGAPGDGYVESQTASGELLVSEPFEMRIDVGALVDRHPSA